VADVQEVVETAIGGAPATALWEGERHFDVVVRLAEASRATLDRLPDIRVATPDGAQVPLAQLARVEVAPGQASITREANMRFVGVRLNVHGRDLAGLNLSVSACIGFIALMGQVVLNGVVLVSQINALRAEGLGLRAAVEAGATRRPRAVLMTALLAALGLLPAALSTQIGSETQ